MLWAIPIIQICIWLFWLAKNFIQEWILISNLRPNLILLSLTSRVSAWAYWKAPIVTFFWVAESVWFQTSIKFSHPKPSSTSLFKQTTIDDCPMFVIWIRKPSIKTCWVQRKTPTPEMLRWRVLRRFQMISSTKPLRHFIARAAMSFVRTKSWSLKRVLSDKV